MQRAKGDKEGTGCKLEVILEGRDKRVEGGGGEGYCYIIAI